MVKVLKVNPYSGIGGGEEVMFSIVQGLRNEFEFIIASPEGFYLEKYKRLNVKIYKLSSVLFKDISKVCRIIKREQPEILHAHGTRAAVLARTAMFFVKKKPKLIYTIHGFHIAKKNWIVTKILLLFERFLNRRTNIAVCVSESDKKEVLKYKTIEESRVLIIKNGIDLKKFERIDKTKTENTKQRLKLDGYFTIITIGRLHEPKDYYTILKALKITLNRIFNIKLLIAGDGPLKDSLVREVKSLRLNNYVKFLGFCRNVPVLINLSDVVILSTKGEGLPLVPIEVGAGRKPIIASDVEGVREVVLNNKTGYLFKKGDAEDLAEKILKLYQDEKLRIRMGEEGYKFVLDNFSKEKMVKEYKRLYFSLV